MLATRSDAVADACRNDTGDMVGYEDARGVVCDLQGQPLAHLVDNELVQLPGSEPDSVAGYVLDPETTAILDADNNVVGSKLYSTPGRPVSRYRVATSTESVVISEAGLTESCGLLRSQDGDVIGSCVEGVSAGLAVVSPDGTIIGDVSADGVVTSSSGADPAVALTHLQLLCLPTP